MPRKAATEPARAIVDYSFEDRTYQIDTQRQKVYRRFVEIETARAFEIYSMWRAENVQA